MQSQFKLINDYFSDLVSKSTKVKKFISISDRELQNALAKMPKEADPFLVLFGYEGKLTGNDQRTIGTRTVSFSILYRIQNPNDIASQYSKIDDAENVGLQFLSRINLDSREGKLAWLHNSFQKDSVNFSEVTYKTGTGLFGCEFHFDLQIKNPLIADAEYWNDKTFCT